MHLQKSTPKKWLIIARNIYAAGLRVGLQNSLAYLQTRERLIYKIVEQEQAKGQIEWADVVVFVRHTDQQMTDLLAWAKQQGKQTLYYVDDSLYEIPLESRESVKYSTVEAGRLLERFIKAVDCLVVCSPWLLQSYEERFGVEGVWINPAIQLPTVEPMSKKNRPLIIGFAGSVDYGILLERLKPAFIELKEKYKEDIQFECFGPKLSFIEAIKGVYYKPVAYDLYEVLMARRQWDIGIAYNEETVFANKKFYNKYLEYGRLGIPGIYSDIELFRRIITAGENGILVENTWQSWMDEIAYLIEHESIRKKIKQKAYAAVLETFSLEQGAREIQIKLETFL